VTITSISVIAAASSSGNAVDEPHLVKSLPSLLGVYGTNLIMFVLKRMVG